MVSRRREFQCALHATDGEIRTATFPRPSGAVMSFRCVLDVDGARQQGLI